MSLKQREIKIKPRIKLNHNIYKAWMPPGSDCLGGRLAYGFPGYNQQIIPNACLPD